MKQSRKQYGYKVNDTSKEKSQEMDREQNKICNLDLERKKMELARLLAHIKIDFVAIPEIKTFYGQLQSTMNRYSKIDQVLLMGDINARVWKATQRLYCL